MKRLAIVGAGPMGLAAALGALDRGLDVTIFERGEIGQSFRAWGSTRFFSPVGMNISPRMRQILGDMPGDDELLTGGEFVERILRPIAASEALRGRLQTNRTVIAVGRRGMNRNDYAGHPLRAERPFRLLVRRTAKEGSAGGPLEEVVEAEAVLDATGGYVVPNTIGSGVPAIGEGSFTPAPIRTLAALEKARDHLAGKRVLLIGDGHSAANAIGILAAIDGVEVTWAVRSANQKPCAEVFGDPLPERQRVVETANELAQAPPVFLTMERRASVERFENRDGTIHVTLTGGRAVACDVVVAFTGFHPADAMQLELAAEVSPVTQGAAGLYRAVANMTDCLSIPRVSPQDLATGEPGFYFIGSRAYGRAGSFLLQTGLAQLETILDALK